MLELGPKNNRLTKSSIFESCRMQLSKFSGRIQDITSEDLQTSVGKRRAETY
jgi:hypothetical protein